MTGTLTYPATAPLTTPQAPDTLSEPSGSVEGPRSTAPHTVAPALSGNDTTAGQTSAPTSASPQNATATTISVTTSRADTTTTTTRPADTLAAQADTLTGLSRDAFRLPFFAGMELENAEKSVVWRNAPAEEVFGTSSTLIQAAPLPAAPAQSLTQNPVFQSFVLLLAGTYAVLLYRNLGDIQLLLTRVSRDTARGKRLTEDPGGSGFSRFLNIATTIGMLFMGVMAVKYGDSLMPRTLTELLPHGAVLALSLLTTLACAAVALFQLALVRLAGAVTLTQPFISQMVLLKRTYFTLAVIVTSPALLLFALCPRGTGEVWFCIIAIELLVTAILYLRETFSLFISKKISILHWILYLCTVEVFPISLIWLLAVRD